MVHDFLLKHNYGIKLDMIEEKIKEIHYLIQSNNLTKAKKIILELIKKHPLSYDLRNLMGLVEAKKDNYKKAITFFKEAININPKLIGAYINTGVAYEKLNELFESIKYLKKAIKINPNLEIVYNSLAKVFSKNNQYNDAILNFKKAIKINPTNYENYFNLANTLSLTFDYKNAILNYKKIDRKEKKFGDINFLIAENFRKLKKIKEALKYYNLSQHEKKMVRILDCYLFLNLKNKYLNEIKLISQDNSNDRRIAASSAYISDQFNIKNEYPFCPNPLDLIYKTNIEKYFSKPDKYLMSLFKEITSQNFKWEPSGKTTVNGYGTVGNLSEKKLPKMNELEKIIMEELHSYYLKFKKNKINFISNWPNKFKIVSWSNRLKREGHNIPHIHPSGWVSGVFYLKIPNKISGNEAGIEFSLHGDDHHVIKKNIPKTSIQPKIGDMILFPSSLFHRTIPFSSNEERVCVAFDLCKVN